MTPQYEPLVLPSYAEAVKNQILSGWLGPGKITEEFEKSICEITGSKYCLSTTSGTTAIILALGSLGLKEDSTVLFPAYTFLAGANAARFLGFNVKLIDVKSDTLCMNPDKLDPAQAVIFVNHNAYVGEDVSSVKDWCYCNNILMIEDSSQALGVKNAGRIGDLGIFSFSIPKLVTTGQGGAIITDNPVLYEKCKMIRDHGDNWRQTRIHNNLGVNFKFNDILATLGLEQLKKIDYLLSERKRVFDAYRKHIKLVDFGYDSTWMVIHRTSHSDEIIAALKNESIQAVKYYKPIHHNPPYYSNNNYPEATNVANECVYLPSSLNLDNEVIHKICKIIMANNHDN